MQDWVDLYLELGDKLMAAPGVRWVDMWHNQVGFLEDEVPFPAPACFLSFRILSAKDTGEKVQELTLQVDVRYFYETFADTYIGAVNQDSAVAFLRGFNAIHGLLHGSSGKNYSSMRRVALDPQDTGNTGNLYLQSFTCIVMDSSAQKQYTEGQVNDVIVENNKGPQSEPPEDNFYQPVIRG